MALGGVAIGSMKAKEQPMTVPSTGRVGEISASLAVAKTMGTKMFAAAVLLTSSVNQTAIEVPQIVKPS